MSEKIDAQTRKKANQYFTVKMLINMGLMLIGILLIYFFLSRMQEDASLARQREDSMTILNEVVTTLKANTEDADDLTTIYHRENQATVQDLIEMMKKGLFSHLVNMTNQERADAFADMILRTGVPYLLVLDPNDRVMVSPNVSYYRKNLVELKMLTEENAAHLLWGTQLEDGTVDPVRETNEYGEYYFYSGIVEYDGVCYSIVIGVDVEDLDVQLRSLKDIGRVLSRSSLNGPGFLFAVDKDRNEYLYYENGEENLTGKNIQESGLSMEALEDGYFGKETINGVEYYCVSRSFGDQVVISAVVTTEWIFGSNHFVIMWSLIGFIVTMILCTAYVVIVRNDFVRNETQTRQVKLGKVGNNNIYYNMTLGMKIIPLMVLGVLVIFGISFYSQTLIGITDSVYDSEAALNEAGIRYEEGQQSRSVITNYYTCQFLAKARLMAYLLEEDPSFLNEDSERIHTIYNSDGVKETILDDEGNPLHAVPYSSRLIELCDRNDLDSIYVYDAAGHTLATNTGNWYFTLSLDPEQQSGPFRAVLDGKIDELVQAPVDDELGNASQYIGVTFTYYTTQSADGETIYLSRYDYENQFINRDSSVITKHRSLLQVGLKKELVQRMLSTTAADYIFSLDSLNGGFMMVFDDTDEHRVIYSPVQSSIGKKASEIGVTSGAFKDGYYGFQRINGIHYFQYFRYNDGMYIAAAIPQSQIYDYRLIIASITSVISLILIILLSIIVTLTTDEEETLYRVMVQNMKSRTDASVFRILLPSGREKNTVKAAARWDNRSLPWRERSPEQKLFSIVSILFGILFVYMIISLFLMSDVTQDESMIAYLLNGRWERGLNVFAYSACAIVLIFTIAIMQGIRLFFRLVSSILGTRSETIAHLMISVVKYGGTLVSFFYCLYLLGLDASSLLASAGILSLVIGLGAQSLIKDILAGMFIVFEGEFRVGDIVTIRDFRGTVMDIGLRTTKIVNGAGNIQIYNNSEISTVLNMTKQLSLAICTIGIEYGQDLEAVEDILKRELPAVKERIPAIVEGPTYIGVRKLSDSSVDLGVMARCKEKDIFAVNSQLTRELYLIFNRNHIALPFRNVTVSYLSEEDKKAGRRETEINDEKIDRKNNQKINQKNDQKNKSKDS